MTVLVRSEVRRGVATLTLDSPANPLSRVKISTLPAAGSLRLSGATFAAGTFVTRAQIDLWQLTFQPAANASGTGYASFTFQVEDDGGTANGGVNLDPSANTITVNVAAVNDTPVLDWDDAPPGLQPLQGNPFPGIHYYRWVASHSLREQPDGSLVWKWHPSVKTRRSTGDVDWWKLLRTIATPTLVLRGEHSTVLDRDVAERMVKELPRGRFVEIPRAVHTLHEDNPDAVFAALRHFLDF